MRWFDVAKVGCVFLMIDVCLGQTDEDKSGHAEIKILSVRKIWDGAGHNAFTDLERFQDQWICAFREGDKHAGAGDYGKIRVISSVNGESWQSRALLERPGLDLRDAKLSVMSSGALLLNSCEYDVDHDSAENRNNQSVTFVSRDGVGWDGPHRIADKGYWLWQTTWRDDVGYALGYRWGKNDATRLYETKDGRTYAMMLDHPRPPGDRSNEHAMVFGSEGTAYMLLRRDNATSKSAGSALFGKASPPYRDWEWKRLSVRLGGPAMIQLPDGRLLTCGRRYADKEHEEWGSQWTELGFIDPESGTYSPDAKLPSGGDSSYAGMVVHDGRLWMSYYSSHEGKTSIYFARGEWK